VETHQVEIVFASTFVPGLRAWFNFVCFWVTKT